MHRWSDGMWPEDQADQQVTEAGRNMQPLKSDHDRNGYAQKKNDLCEMNHMSYWFAVLSGIVVKKPGAFRDAAPHLKTGGTGKNELSITHSIEVPGRMPMPGPDHGQA